MARVPGDHHAGSLGQKTMTSTVQCPACGEVLNVPKEAAGRKLKCPKCATKFQADSSVAGSGPSSTMFPTRKAPGGSSGDFDMMPRAGSSGSVELPTSGRPGNGGGDFDLPSSPASLRETFDLPLLGEDLPSPKAAAGKASVGDAMSLFRDEPKPRKPKGAEARAKARRCPSCGGVVGVGMSLCGTCGLDLDTGQRVAPLDVFDDDIPEAPREETPPLGVLFVGSLAALVNLLLGVASLVAFFKGEGVGFLCLMVIWAFGIFASVQFLRLKSIRPLFLALGLGAGIGLVYLIALPIWEANQVTDAAGLKPGDALPPADPFDPDAPRIRNLAEEIDLTRIYWGIFVLLAYAAIAFYLNTPSVKRQFHRN